MELLIVLKYLGYFVSAVGAVIGIFGESTVVTNTRGVKLTLKGYLSLFCIVIGTLLSIKTESLQYKDELDEKEEQLSQQKQDTRTKDSLWVVQTNRHLRLLGELNIQTRKSNKISINNQKKDSIDKDRNTKILNEFFHTNTNIFEQLLVENYLESLPENVNFLIDIPLPKEQALKYIENQRLKISWTLTNQKISFLIRGRLRTKKVSNYELITLKNGKFCLGDPQCEESHIEYLSDLLGDYTNNNVTDNSLISLNVLANKNGTTTLILNLNDIEFQNNPWQRVSDFRNNKFDTMYTLDENGSKENNIICDFSIFFDQRFKLQVGSNSRFRDYDRLKAWQTFRKDVSENLKLGKNQISLPPNLKHLDYQKVIDELNKRYQ